MTESTEANSEKNQHSETEITVLIESAANGNDDSLNQLIPLIYPELKRIASGLKKKQFNYSETLNTTSLVNEAWLKLEKFGVKATNRTHFFCIVAKAMRQILINAAMAKKSIKRDAFTSSLDDIEIANTESADWLLKLDDVITAVGTHNSRAEEVFQLKYFLGLEHAEIAKILDVSEKTSMRDWASIKQVMKQVMS